MKTFYLLMAYLSEFNQFQSEEREHNPPKTALASNTNCVKVLTKVTLRFSNSPETIAKLHESCNTNVCVLSLSVVCLNPCTLWTAACPAPLGDIILQLQDTD